MKQLAATIIAVFAVATVTVGCSGKKPCAGISTPSHVAALGIVLEGGKVCKDGKKVVMIDYPAVESAAALKAKYQTELGSKGWKVSTGKIKGTVVARRGKSFLLVVTMKSKKRGVPVAIIRY